MAKKKDDKPKEKPRRRTEKFRTQHRCALTIEEVADRADRAAHLLADRDAKEAEHKAATKHVNGIIQSMESEIRRLSNDVRDRATYQMVDCERIYDYETGRISELRKDTGEQTAERAMTDEERQQELSFEDVEDEFAGDEGSDEAAE